MRIFLFLVILTIMPLPAFAQDEVQVSNLQTRIEVDEVNHVIRFFIKGKESARLTDNGLEVLGNVAYGGTIRDQGRERFNGLTEDKEEAADAP